MTRRLLVLLLPLLLPLPAPAAEGESEGHNAAHGIQTVVQQVSDAVTEHFTDARKKDLAKYIPAGREVTVTLSYRVLKPAPAEEMEVRILDDIYPSPVQILAEQEYRQEQTKIVGTGEYLQRGAPAYPNLSPQEQLTWITWNQWREKSRAWSDREKKINPQGLTIGPRTDPDGQPYVPQVDEKWLQNNADLLDRRRRQPPQESRRGAGLAVFHPARDRLAPDRRQMGAPARRRTAQPRRGGEGRRGTGHRAR